jgi:UDPglucose 6-dehydrogenase/GDP-mannose 6-dehydrogenase
MMKICIIGTGYVGLVTGVCLAAKGHQVVCVDKDGLIVERLNEGEPHFYEDGLASLLQAERQTGRFCATTNLLDGLTDAEIVMIAVGTPSLEGRIDLTSIRDVAREIGRYIGQIDHHISVVVKSTVLPTTTDSVVKGDIEAASGKRFPEFGLGMNPEFLREGCAIADFMEPDRIVLGYEDQTTLDRLQRLYAPWRAEKLAIPTRTAELLKYANNTMLACQISAMNEIANLAASIGDIDIMDVVAGITLDKRWNPILADGKRAAPQILSYLVPGCGFGGSCFPKDVQALRSQGEALGLPMRMLNAVLDVNDAQPDQVATILRRELGDLKDRVVLLLGLAFKPGTDDARESASLKISEKLLLDGCRVKAHDPKATENFQRLAGPSSPAFSFTPDWQSEVAAAEIIIIATAWPEYHDILSHDLAGKTLFDGRRMFTADQLPAGALYLTIGRRVHH